MHRQSIFREFQGLLAEAVAVLGEQRVALGAGCDRSSIRSWLRRREVLLSRRTVETILPQLRTWRSWTAGHQAACDEIGRLEAEVMACWDNRVHELRSRLDEAMNKHPLYQLALGCEVPERRLLGWRVGLNMDRYLDDMVRALAHLRHLDEWPITHTEDVDEVRSHSMVLAEAPLSNADSVPHA